MVILLFAVSILIAAQSTAPCDKACFQRKMAKEAGIKRETNPTDNSWRYPKSYYYRRDR